MIGLPAPFYNIDAFLTTFLVFGVCPQRSPGTEDDRPPLPPAPCRLKRPARAPGNERLTVWQTVRIVWSNIPLSCVVVDSSALSTPAANRSARIRDIRLYVTCKRQNLPSLAATVLIPAIDRRAVVRSGRRLGTGYFHRVRENNL